MSCAWIGLFCTRHAQLEDYKHVMALVDLQLILVRHISLRLYLDSSSICIGLAIRNDIKSFEDLLTWKLLSIDHLRGSCSNPAEPERPEVDHSLTHAEPHPSSVNIRH